MRTELDRGVANIEMNGMNLTLGMNRASNEVQISNRISRCRFRFDESKLTRIELGFKWCGAFSCMVI